MNHVTFPETCISSHMAPESAVSTSDSGYHDGEICQASHKMFSKSVEALNIERTVEVLTDSHASRFDPDVMQFCRKDKINQFIRSNPTIRSNVCQSTC